MSQDFLMLIIESQENVYCGNHAPCFLFFPVTIMFECVSEDGCSWLILALDRAVESEGASNVAIFIPVWESYRI